MMPKVGIFHSMNRLIIVAEPAENAYIEGSIDNVVLSIPAATTQAISKESITPTPQNSNENKTLPLNNASHSASQSSPSLILPLSVIAIMGIIFALKKKEE
jgi:hypothetical protein